MSEWPLIVFTVAIQSAAGLALAATYFERSGTLADEIVHSLGVAVFPLAAFGLLVSLFHLGRPLSAWKAILNLGHSRLSLEVLLTLIFVAAAFLYSYSWWAGKSSSRFPLGLITSIAALAAVASGAAIYLVPTQPAWHSGWVPVSFMGTMILLGGSATAVFAAGQAPASGLGRSLVGIVAGGLLLIVAAAWMMRAMTQSSPDPYSAAQLQGACHLLALHYPAWLILHLLLAVAVPLAFAVLCWLSEDTANLPAWLPAVNLVAAASGSLIGRSLLFIAAGPQPPF